MSKQSREWKAAKVAYEGYCKNTDWKSLATGDSLPIWEKLPQAIREAWYVSTQAVIKFIKRNDQS